MKNFLLVLLTFCSLSVFAQSITSPDPIIFGDAPASVTISVSPAAGTAHFFLFSDTDPVNPIYGGATTTGAFGAVETITFTIGTMGSGATAEIPGATSSFFLIFANESDPNSGTFAVTASQTVFGALPIELKSFTAASKDETVALSWVTSTEENNEFFTLERSFDGKEFADVTKIEGAGTSEEEITYDFSDETVTRVATANTAYYRLKQTDFDGAFAYSDVISVNLKNRAELEVTNVFAAGNELSINFTAPTNGTTEINIYDMTGRLVASAEQETIEGFNAANVVLNDNQSGIFIVNISNGQTQTIRKFVK